MKKALALIVAIVMVLAMTTVLACAADTLPIGTTNLPANWDDATDIDWDYSMSSAVFKATYTTPMWLQAVYSTDVNCPEWAWQEAGLDGAPDVSTWYGTDGTDGALSSLQALETGGTYQLQNSYNIWDAVAAVQAKVDALDAVQKGAAADEIAYFGVLKDKCVEMVGNVNGQYSAGISSDTTTQGAFYMASIIYACGDAIEAAAGNPGTSDVAPVIAIFAGITVLAAAAVVLKKKVA